MGWLEVGSFHLLNLANQKDFKLTLIKKSCRGAAEAFTRISFLAVKLVIRMRKAAHCHLPLSQGCWSTPGSLKTGTVYVTHNLSPTSASVRQVGQNLILILTSVGSRGLLHLPIQPQASYTSPEPGKLSAKPSKDLPLQGKPPTKYQTFFGL